MLVQRHCRMYKINTQKSVLFLYICNEQFKMKLSKQFHLSKRIEHLGINLIIEVQDFYPKNYKTSGKGDGNRQENKTWSSGNMTYSSSHVLNI